jgi:hypothetical protein
MSDLELSDNTSEIDMKFIGNKRKNDLTSNFIFRKFLTGKISGDYEKASNRFSTLFSFDWDDEQIVKSNQSNKSNYFLN